MAAKLNKTDRAKYDRLMKKFDKGDITDGDLLQFALDMDEKYGEPMHEIKGFNKGGMMKKKGYAKGGMKKKGYSKGGAGSKLKMVNKGGKKVPFYAADGKGKMYGGGMSMKKKGMAKGGATMKKMSRGGFLAPAARPMKGIKK